MNPGSNSFGRTSSAAPANSPRSNMVSKYSVSISSPLAVLTTKAERLSNFSLSLLIIGWVSSSLTEAVTASTSQYNRTTASPSVSTSVTFSNIGVAILCSIFPILPAPHIHKCISDNIFSAGLIVRFHIPQLASV